MQKGAYVYSPKEGFGIIINVSSSALQIYFYNKGLTQKTDLGIKEIPSTLVNFINNYNTGYGYTDFVRNISYGQYGLTGEVMSGGIKRPTINIDNMGVIITRCSCNKAQPCRHIESLIEECQVIFKDLEITKKEYIHLDELKSELEKYDCNALNLLTRNQYTIANNLDIIKELEKQKVEYIYTFLEYLSIRIMDSQDRDLLLKMIFANDTIREKINLNKTSFYELDNYDHLRSYLNKQKRNLGRRDNHNLNIIHALVNFGIKEAFLKLIEDIYWEDTMLPIYKFIFQNCNIDQDIIDSLAKKNIKDINSSIFKYSSEQNKKILLEQENIIFDIDYDFFNQQSIETQNKIVAKINIKNDSEARDFLKNIKESSDEKYKYKSLCAFRNYGYFYRFSNDIEKITAEMKYSNYLQQYLSDRYELRPWLMGDSYIPSNRKFFDGISDYLFYYFNFGVSGEIFEDRYEDEYLYKMQYILADACRKTVLKVSVYKDKSIKCSINKIDGQFSSEMVEAFVYFANVNYQEMISEARKQLEEKTENLNRERKLEKIKQTINLFDQEYTKNNIVLKEGRKAELEYNFLFQRSPYESNKYYLGLRIGIDKKYIVKNFEYFIKYFLTNATIRYGKNFEFTHNINNFVEKDQKVIRQLLDFFSNFDGYADKNIELNTYQLEKLLLLLKDEIVNINDKSYLIKLEDIKPEISIDENYQINLSFNQDCDLLQLHEDVYIMDKEKQIINRLDCNVEEKQLVVFAKENNGLCIESVKEDFKDKVYSRYSETIKVADSLKEEFKAGILEIETYFDYDDKKISYTTKYLINNSEIKEEDLKKNADIRKKEDYKTLLANYGFKGKLLSDDSLTTFFNRDFSDLKKYSKVYLSESIKNKQLVRFSPAKIQITYNNNLISAFMDESQYSNSELEEIIKAFKKKKKYVLLKDNRIVDFENPEVKDFVDTIDELGLNPKKLKDDNRISMVQGLKALAHENNCKVDDYLKKMIDDISNFKNDKTPLPKINASLRRYQEEGYHWLKNLCKYNVGGILADDMGLGKTLEIITLIASDDTQKPNLIVCPKSLIFNWRNEFERFAPGEKVVEIYGLKNQREDIIKAIKDDEKVNYITSYDSLRNDIDSYKTKINIMIIDEAQYIKNVNALKTQTVKQIEATHKIALTGTPIENNIIDLWSIFDFIMPGYFESLEKFKTKYNSNEEFVHVVAKRIAPFVLRRTKANVLKDLPEKFERILTAEMGDEQRKVYDAFRKKAKDAMSQDGAKAFDMLPYLTRLRQICVDPTMFYEGYKGNSAKFDALTELVDEYLKDGHRILIFSQFVKALENIEKKLNLPCFKITGDVDSKTRHEICEKFNAGSEENIVLISLKAGGTGLNLTGADVVIHIDPWWNVSAENQASDRSHRIGQTKNVEVIKLICEDSIEQRVIELQNKKKDLIDKMISNDESSVVGASLEDIKFMLQ